jgi:hypothetical protein
MQDTNFYFPSLLIKKMILLFCALGSAFALDAQKKIAPKVSTSIYKLGSNRIPVKLFQYGRKKDIVFINLHSDETTSVTAAKKILQANGGLLIKLENNNKRNIRFQLDKKIFVFDPNRIFSKTGIGRSLARFNSINDKAVEEVNKFAIHILKLIPKESHCVIALHNNNEGGLSINSFLRGNQYEIDAKKVYADDAQDPDDFFLTTDSLLFEQLSAEKYNIVWLDNLRARQDGSLSVYFGEKNTRYLNCETEHGKTSQYAEMLQAVLKHIDQRKK